MRLGHAAPRVRHAQWQVENFERLVASIESYADEHLWQNAAQIWMILCVREGLFDFPVLWLLHCVWSKTDSQSGGSVVKWPTLPFPLQG